MSSAAGQIIALQRDGTVKVKWDNGTETTGRLIVRSGGMVVVTEAAGYDRGRKYLDQVPAPDPEVRNPGAPITPVGA